MLFCYLCILFSSLLKDFWHGPESDRTLAKIQKSPKIKQNKTHKKRQIEELNHSLLPSNWGWNLKIQRNTTNSLITSCCEFSCSATSQQGYATMIYTMTLIYHSLTSHQIKWQINVLPVQQIKPKIPSVLDTFSL